MLNRLKFLFVGILTFIISVCCLGLFACNEKGNDGGDTPPPSSSVGAGSEVTLNKSLIKLEVGSNTTLVADAPDAEADDTIEWISYNPSVATVDQNGKVVALSEGKTVIVATLGSYSDSCDVTVVKTATAAENLFLEISSKNIVLNSESDYDSAEINVIAYYNGQPITADVAWLSSNPAITVTPDLTDGASATISATANDVSATVTAKLTYAGITATATCTVVSEKFAYVLPDSEEISVFEGDTHTLDYTLYVGGVINDAEKANVSFESSNTAVATVSNAGEITAVSSGNAKIILSYGAKTATVNLIVGEVKYVSTPEQFYAMDGSDAYTKYVLSNDIDLSEDLWINNDSFINEFNGTLDGANHTVYGLNRYSTETDVGFSGIFKKLGKYAVVKNVRFVTDVDAKSSLNVFVNVNYGLIENCILDAKVNSSNPTYMLFSLNVGSVVNTVANVDFEVNDNVKLEVADNGNAYYTGFSLIASKLTMGVEGKGLTGSAEFADKYFIESYYYESITAFKEKTAYAIIGEGKGAAKDFGTNQNYDETLFAVDTKVTFNGAAAVNYAFERDEEKTYEVAANQSLAIELPSRENGVVTVLDPNDAEATLTTYADGQFKATFAGTYKLSFTSEKGAVKSGTLYVINVTKERVELDSYAVALTPSKSTNITIDGNMLPSSEYTFVSDNARVAEVGVTGTIVGKKEGRTTVRVTNKTTKTVYCISVTVKDSFRLQEFNGVVFAGSTQESKIYVNGEFVGTTESDKFDLYGYLVGINAAPGKYEIAVENGDNYDYAIYQIIALNNDNFMTAIKEANTFDKAQYKMYVLEEDITLKPWTNESYGDIAYTSGNDNYVVNELFANIDGKGHKLSLSYDARSKGRIFSGLAMQINAGIRNLVYELNATYVEGGLRYYFCDYMRSGGLDNVVFKINARCVNAAGEEIKDTKRTPCLINWTNSGTASTFSSATTASYNDVIIVFNAGAETQNDLVVFNRNVANSIFRNFVIVSNAPNTTLCVQLSNPRNTYLLDNLATLLKGGNGYLISSPLGNNQSLTATPVTFDSFDLTGEFSLTAQGLTLCGKLVYGYGIFGGETIVPDSSIISK